jgi:hypothetical protein
MAKGTLLTGGVGRRITHVRPHILYDRSWESIAVLKGDDFVLTPQQMANDIIHGRAQYFTREDGTEAPVQVEYLGLGAYVRTRADCSSQNNLLNLSRF